MKSSDGWLRAVVRVIIRTAAIATGGTTLLKELFWKDTGGQTWVWLRICFVLACVAEWYEMHKDLRNRDRSISDLESCFHAKPRIVPAENALRPDTFSLRDSTRGRIIEPRVHCIRLRLINAPLSPGDEAEAAGVRASITFRRPDGTLLFRMDGRWADSPQASEREPSRDITTVLSVPFPIQQERSLDIAIKHPMDAECYGMSNDSYQTADWRLPSQVLPVGTILGQARLSGKFIDTDVSFQFKNEGTGKGLVPLKYDFVNNIVPPPTTK